MYYVKPDLRVHRIRPVGHKCVNLTCPYNDIAYDQERFGTQFDSYNGLCLNCVDDCNIDVTV